MPADFIFQSRNATLTVSGECVSANEVTSVMMVSDLPEPEKPISTECMPIPYWDVSLRSSSTTSPVGSSPMGKRIHSRFWVRRADHSRSTSSLRASRMPRTSNRSRPGPSEVAAAEAAPAGRHGAMLRANLSASAMLMVSATA
jgi:hypothetical protein